MGLSDRLRDSRHRAGLSQEALGERLNVGRSTVANYERGEHEPDLDYLRGVSRVCGVSLSWLIDDAPTSLPLAIERFAAELADQAATTDDLEALRDLLAGRKLRRPGGK